MRYEQISSSGSYPYPNNNIDPKEKGLEFCMAYTKAAYCDWSFSYPKGIFYNNAGDYEKYRLYALGKQPISQYKKWNQIDEQDNNTWLSVDWTVRPVISRYRDKAISRLMKQTYGIIATPIDITAKSELDTYYAEMKSKLIVRQLIQGVNKELASHPLISLQSGEPMDIEELEMRVSLGEQFNRSRDAEQAIELGFYENGAKHFVRGVYEDLFDYGVAGYKEWLGDDNKAKFRKVNPECVITNFCKQSDFSDMIHAGEVIDVSLIDLAVVKNKEGNPVFSEEELVEFAGTLAGKFGNPQSLGSPANGGFKPYDKFKCKIFDIEFYSYDDYNYRDAPDQYGNNDFRKMDYNRGKKSDKYISKRAKNTYKCKWVIGTDKCYDFGLCNDIKRSVNPKKKSYTTLSFKFIAYNFYEMKAQGFMERLIPYLDDYQMTMLKIQNWKNRAVPPGWWLDLDALENIALSKGGVPMQPKEVLKMFFETGILLGRSHDAQNNPMSPNWKPIIPTDSNALAELPILYNDLIITIQQIEATVGYNPTTSGDPNPKTLVPGLEAAQESTDDAISALQYAQRHLTLKLAEDVLCRMQQGVRRGSVEGSAPYTNALNQNTLMFIKVSEEICTREYGIMLEERTTEAERIWLLQNMQQDIANGYLDSSDAVYLINTHNVKQAQMIWAYRVKKAKEAQAAQKQAELQTVNQGNAQLQQQKNEFELQKLQLDGQIKLSLEKEITNRELLKEQIRQQKENEVTDKNVMGKVAVQSLANQGKEIQTSNS